MALIDNFPGFAPTSRRCGFALRLADLLFKNAKIQASSAEASTAARQTLPSSLDVHTALYIQSLSR